MSNLCTQGEKTLYPKSHLLIFVAKLFVFINYFQQVNMNNHSYYLRDFLSPSQPITIF